MAILSSQMQRRPTIPILTLFISLLLFDEVIDEGFEDGNDSTVQRLQQR